MLTTIKRHLYFFVARYFTLWAGFRLRRWQPTIIVVTGSSGKTTTLHLLESQLGKEAAYSHHANSLYGIAFDLLDLRRTTLQKAEWLWLFVAAPFKAFTAVPTQRLYVVEVDCDRPREGQLLAQFLRPHTVVWLSSERTHSMNFDAQVRAGAFTSVDAAIAHEFGYLAEYAREQVVVNADNPRIVAQLGRAQAAVTKLSLEELKHYELSSEGTRFGTKQQHYALPYLVPKPVFYSVLAAQVVMKQLGHNFDAQFTGLTLPPGRSSVFRGVHNTTLIDSTYNSSQDAALAMLELYAKYHAPTKWLVLSDILEQGSNEAAAHHSLAEAVRTLDPARIVLMGPRMAKHLQPELAKQYGPEQLVQFQGPREVLDYLQAHLHGGETILFKGARFLEGVVEHLLADPADAAKLCRREAVWQKRRKAWGV